MNPLSIKPGYTDILAQQGLCTRLWTAFRSGRLHHCYLFEGPAGVGKATVALRLAMAANCTGEVSVPPCTTCPTCRLIREKRHPDVLMVVPDIQKATEVITVDQAREVIHTLMLHRHSARRRFVIIDPADLMRVEATNALLKTLEEPPLDTTFILVTSRYRLLLPTVISRSLRIHFKGARVPELTQWLLEQGIGQAERIARLSFGSPGRALLLAEGGLAELDQTREGLLSALEGAVSSVLSFAEKVTGGPRTSWEPRVMLLLEVLEILLRDTVALASSSRNLLFPECRDVTSRWMLQMWPHGVRRMQDAIAEARARLLLNVNARVVLEALLLRLLAELGPMARCVA